ncbi:P-loop NTPase fold protein [Emticicia sp. SJ17W-69]|uniref:P-loop NTPase fold protein n=1 Tax=Emticicia sp. SJ17W-69 TaxID=3421657 RepID=UPI003EBF4F56
MKHIDEAILNYIEQANTDYAVLLTGKWGSGKTYYLNNILKEKIEAKNFKMIVISLYGVSTIKEVSTMIFAERSPKLAGIIKYGGPIVKSFFKSIDIADYLKFGIDEIDGNKDTNVSINQEKVVDETSSWLGRFTSKKQENGDVKEENIILCFDDLERKNDVLTNKEIIGYINNFAEKGTKVIVLADEDKIESNEEFKKLKEKTFGLSLEFEQKQEDTIKEIIKRGFEEDKIFTTFLEDKIDYIGDIFFKHSKNLRILKFGLNCFHHIFSKVEKEKRTFKYVDLGKTCDDLLKFVLTISIEFRENRISFENRRGIDINVTETEQEMNTFIRKLKLEGAKSETPETNQDNIYKNTFLEKYYFNTQYTYFLSAYNYLTSGYLNEEELISELKDIDRKAIKPAYQIYNKLFSNGFHGLLQYNDSELKQYFQDIINYAKNGDYEELNDYSTIYFYIQNYSEYGFDLDDLERNFLEVIKNKVLINADSETLKSFRVTQKYTEEIDNQKSSHDFGDKVSELIDEELLNREAFTTKNIDEENLDTIIAYLEKDVNNSSLSRANVEILFNKLSKAENKDLQKFHSILIKRWESEKFYYIKNEKQFIISLEILLSEREEIVSEKNKNITFKRIKSVLKETLKTIQEFEKLISHK